MNVRPRRRVTIRDVARVAQVSHQTVSRVINDESSIRPQTRERVLKTIAELGFRPNQIARSLVTRKTNIVGLLISNITNPFFPDIVSGAQDVLYPSGCNMILANTGYDPHRELESVHHLLERHVDGLIVCDTRTTPEVLADLAGDFSTPMVLLNRTTSAPQVGIVRTERVAAADEAVSYLLELGHRRIALLLAGRTNDVGAQRRLEGYTRALERAGIPLDEGLIVRGVSSVPGGNLAAEDLLGLSPVPTAVLCHNDVMAIGLMQGCTQRGLSIPADLSIVGWDDIAYASVVSPPLTTVRIPRYELGQEAARMLLELMRDGQANPDEVILPITLVRRGSTGPPRVPTL